jgi:hypothetical protein
LAVTQEIRRERASRTPPMAIIGSDSHWPMLIV